MKTLDDAVALWPSDLGGSMFDVLELQKELEGMLIRPSTVLPAVVAEDGVDPRPVLFEERQDALVEDVDGRDRDLRVVQVAPGIAGVAIDDGLQVDLSDALEVSDHEGVDSHKLTGKISLDMAFPELRIKPFEEADLLFRELHARFLRVLFKAEQPLVLGQEVAALPDTADGTGSDVDAS